MCPLLYTLVCLGHVWVDYVTIFSFCFLTVSVLCTCISMVFIIILNKRDHFSAGSCDRGQFTRSKNFDIIYHSQLFHSQCTGDYHVSQPHGVRINYADIHVRYIDVREMQKEGRKQGQTNNKAKNNTTHSRQSLSTYNVYIGGGITGHTSTRTYVLNKQLHVQYRY